MTDASWFGVSRCKHNIQIPEVEMHNFIPEKNTISQLISTLILLCIMSSIMRNFSQYTTENQCAALQASVKVRFMMIPAFIMYLGM